MIDLTPLEVRKKKGDFKKALRGYEPALVDDFLDLVADRLDQLVRENNAMTERLNRAEHQVSDNRERERALTDALVTAQEMREEMRVQTTREADLMRRTAEQQVAQMRGAAEQESAQMIRSAELESARIRNEAVQLREREEEVLRRLRARQQQLLQSYRTFLAREMAELQVIGETLEIEGMAPVEQLRSARDSADRRPERTNITSTMEQGSAAMQVSSDARAADVAAAAAVVAAAAIAPVAVAAPLEFAAPAELAAPMEFAAPVETLEPAAEFQELDIFGHADDAIHAEPDFKDDMLAHATVMGALEVAILEDDEPFAPEPVEEDDMELALEEIDAEDDEEQDDNLAPHDAYADADELAVHKLVGRTEPEAEIGAPDHDANVLLENALKAGYRIDLDDDDDDLDELLLEDEDADTVDADEDAEPPQGWLDKMIDDKD